jgi:hypothetical protein
VKGFDSADVCYIVDYSFLEANRAIIIDLCDRVWTLSIDRLLFCLVSEFLNRERLPAMIVRQLPLAARLTLRVGTRDGPTLSTSDDGRKETDYQS